MCRSLPDVQSHLPVRVLGRMLHRSAVLCSWYYHTKGTAGLQSRNVKVLSYGKPSNQLKMTKVCLHVASKITCPIISDITGKHVDTEQCRASLVKILNNAELWCKSTQRIQVTSVRVKIPPKTIRVTEF